MTMAGEDGRCWWRRLAHHPNRQMRKAISLSLSLSMFVSVITNAFGSLVHYIGNRSMVPFLFLGGDPWPCVKDS